MDMALGLAARGTGWTTPNPMVGAVVVQDGEIVGQGWHQKAGGPHAEVHALIDAGDRAAGATLYVTLEPCHHHGRTPPCTEKILAAGIRRVVMAMQDPNPDVRGGGGDYLRQHGVSVTSGIREAEARRLNERFIKFIT
ncbi:MAG: bifunctional diaminohydroxyphosphoribosylaminopyrimidine deaminase/5-amino-6-(5-phosphoribosylamino)uracil reductase RibD, partial [Desulfococcus multivorans]|nr:bifunctional diaminohydroxyphosphoribosylaminopyrimidine deaminase/5-amino-6-(5-phosphoribosylamino)uracil reductase RibD [Desulfococcus multivorans]